MVSIDFSLRGMAIDDQASSNHFGFSFSSC
ncbi:hypothetical protein SAMN05421823_101231 [Catalinimonas alkaloidigena]|uniref:Uncharacterized protein n=1 Tax=Catalinimonas alkaloidigena TaxID=1075417 RepID=A0A1G8X110_9BACT|nr:hypothetical protein SAMN05421823_101231 [Catalinimonas alkaloidigena]